VAQQQCVGPLQLPISDVAVFAQSHQDTTGLATSIGEQVRACCARDACVLPLHRACVLLLLLVLLLLPRLAGWRTRWLPSRRPASQRRHARRHGITATLACTQPLPAAAAHRRSVTAPPRHTPLRLG
jgi:hypothetical protein